MVKVGIRLASPTRRDKERKAREEKRLAQLQSGTHITQLAEPRANLSLLQVSRGRKLKRAGYGYGYGFKFFGEARRRWEKNHRRLQARKLAKRGIGQDADTGAPVEEGSQNAVDAAPVDLSVTNDDAGSTPRGSTSVPASSSSTQGLSPFLESVLEVSNSPFVTSVDGLRFPGLDNLTYFAEKEGPLLESLSSITSMAIPGLVEHTQKDISETETLEKDIRETKPSQSDTSLLVQANEDLAKTLRNAQPKVAFGLPPQIPSRLKRTTSKIFSEPLDPCRFSSKGSTAGSTRSLFTSYNRRSRTRHALATSANQSQVAGSFLSSSSRIASATSRGSTKSFPSVLGNSRPGVPMACVPPLGIAGTCEEMSLQYSTTISPLSIRSYPASDSGPLRIKSVSTITEGSTVDYPSETSSVLVKPCTPSLDGAVSSASQRVSTSLSPDACELPQDYRPPDLPDDPIMHKLAPSIFRIANSHALAAAAPITEREDTAEDIRDSFTIDFTNGQITTFEQVDPETPVTQHPTGKIRAHRWRPSNESLIFTRKVDAVDPPQSVSGIMPPISPTTGVGLEVDAALLPRAAIEGPPAAAGADDAGDFPSGWKSWLWLQ